MNLVVRLLVGENLIGKIFTQFLRLLFLYGQKKGLWGGNSTWDGGMNRLTWLGGRGYTKGHTRALYADMAFTTGFVIYNQGFGCICSYRDTITLLHIGKTTGKVPNMVCNP